MKSYGIILVLCLVLINQGELIFAQSDSVNPWQAIPTSSNFSEFSASYYSLNLSSIQSILSNAPLELSVPIKSSNCVLSLPMPKGEHLSFNIVESPIVEQKLLNNYPLLKTYLGTATHNPSIVIRLSYTSIGFHAAIKDNQNTIFIDPTTSMANTLYKSYYFHDSTSDETFVCHSSHMVEHDDLSKQNDIQAVGNEIRMFRLAISTTGEYAQFHGGTVEESLSAIVNTINRVNLFFELETSTRFILIGNNDDIIFTDPVNDPFNNNSLNEMLAQNQTVIDNIIGPANYDIGHIFGTKGGGLAGVGSACSNVKAWGATGLSSPVGDAFDIVYVAHELGHQLNAPHSFNGCNGTGGGATAFEPGSGTTVMAYAGLCGDDNIQFSTDYYFHSGSYERIVNGGSLCNSIAPTNNTPPVVDALDPNGLTIPISTPFELIGIGYDTDGDELTYTWDQMDLGPISPLGIPNGNGPLFRFMPPTEDPIRTFPNIVDLKNNVSTNSEILPNYSRSLNFRITARDNRAGNGGVNFDDYSMEVTELAGPFLVTSPNAATDYWIIGESATIQWDVANTNIAPVNCSEVSILLSMDGGLSYPITLAEDIPNNGQTTIETPNLQGTQNRIKIKGSNHVFFDISNANFVIAEPTYPSFLVTPSITSTSLCQNDVASYSLNVSALGGFNDEITFSAIGVPQGASIEFSPISLQSSGTVEVLINNLDQVEGGLYPFEIIAHSSNIDKSVDLEVHVLEMPSNSYSDIIPSDESRNVPFQTTLSWEQDLNAITYQVELASSPAFENTIISGATTIENTFHIQNLTPLTIYYWRIKGQNDCGEGQFSDVYAFQTKPEACYQFQSEDTPIPIISTSPSTIISTISVTDDFPIVSFSIPNIQGTHSFISDLNFLLISPNENTFSLTAPVCGGNQNFDFGFDDESTSITLDCPPTSGQSVQPSTSFSSLIGNNSVGEWHLVIQDIAAQDGGSLENWSLEICRSIPPIEQPMLLNNNEISVNQVGSVLISKTELEAIVPNYTASEVHFSIRKNPHSGVLKLEANSLHQGGVFLQSNINEEQLSYVHDGSNNFSDYFIFDVLTSDGGWLASNRFDINIVPSNLNIEANLIKEASCYNSPDAQVAVTPFGGMPPYQYSLEGSVYQTSSIFTNLSPGNYVFWVKDAQNFVALTQTIEITNPPEIIVQANVLEDQITVIASGGVGQLQYSIDGVNFGPNTTFSNLENGLYTITVRDENFCRSTTHAEIAINNLEVLALVEEAIRCHDSHDGKISANVQGGTPPFVYSIDNNNYQQSPIFENLGPGNYNIYVEEIEGFAQISETIELIAPTPIEVTAESTENVLNISAGGGTGILLYSIDGTNFQSDPNFNITETGSLTVFVQDANGCISSIPATINYQSLLAVGTLDQAISCYGMNDALISLTAIGGTPPYEYQLGNNTAFQSDNQFEGLAAGNYPFNVKDYYGFVFSGSPIIVVDPAELVLDAIINNNSVTAIGSGGTGSLSYQINDGNWQESSEFDNLPLGNNILRTKDENDCISEMLILISTTSIEYISENKLGFEVIPNPNNGNFVVELESPTQNPNWSIQLEDIQGRIYKVNNYSLSPSGIHIELPQLPNGLFQLLLTNGKQWGVERMIKL